VIEPLSIGSLVAVLVAKAMERAEDKALDQGESVLGQLAEKLRQRLSSSSDPASTVAIEHLEQAPDSPRLQGHLAAALDAHAAIDPSFRSELEALATEARDAGVNVDSITQIALGSGNIQIGHVADSEINVMRSQPTDDGAPPSSDNP
jgi:hypothetical protein